MLAAPLICIALSGLVLLFKDPLLLPADWRRAEAPPAEADAEVVRLLGNPAVRNLESIAPARADRGFHLAKRRDGTPEWWLPGAALPVASDQLPWRLRLETRLIDLHGKFLLGRPGEFALKFIAPLAALLLFAGLVLWWPLRRGWRWRDLPVRQAGRPQLLRAHLALGALAGVLGLLHASSGAMLANNPAIRDWLAPLVEARASEWPAGAGSREFAPGNPRAAIAALRRLHPAGRITLLSPPDGATGAWTLKLRLPGEAHPNGRSFVALDVGAGHVGEVRDARAAGLPGVYDDLLYPLHLGTLFGGWQRWVWLASGIALARLALLGALAYSRRGRGPARRA